MIPSFVLIQFSYQDPKGIFLSFDQRRKDVEGENEWICVVESEQEPSLELNFSFLKQKAFVSQCHQVGKFFFLNTVVGDRPVNQISPRSSLEPFIYSFIHPQTNY